MKSEKKKNQNRIKKCFVLFMLLFTFHFSPLTAFTAESSTIEIKIKDFIRKFYNEREDIYIKLNHLPDSLRDKSRIKHINFTKIPDSNGDGLCLVEVDEKNGRTKNVYVSFKISNKRKLFVLKQSAQKGDAIRSDEIMVKEAYMTGNGTIYPARIEEVVGKVLKRDINAGTVITCQVLEDSFVIQRGDTVNIMAENKKLLVQAKGRTLEKGKMGDIIRVKNLTSNKEIVGRVTGSGTVKVDL